MTVYLRRRWALPRARFRGNMRVTASLTLILLRDTALRSINRQDLPAVRGFY